MAHDTFEALHPFHDGNGRLGRLFVVVHLHGLGVLTEPSITVSPWFESRRQRYHDALMGVSTEGDWSTWVQLFAEGLRDSADDARHRMLDLTEVQSDLKERVQASALRTANARLLVDFAVARPTFSVKDASAALGMQRPGAKKLIDSLVALGVLEEYGDRNYDRRFHAPEVVRVLLSGSHPSPR
jgi:Fic family protein